MYMYFLLELVHGTYLDVYTCRRTCIEMAIQDTHHDTDISSFEFSPALCPKVNPAMRFPVRREKGREEERISCLDGERENNICILVIAPPSVFSYIVDPSTNPAAQTVASGLRITRSHSAA